MNSDRRNHPRARFATVRVLLDGQDGPTDEFLEELSAGGLLLRTDRTLPVGSRLEVEIRRPGASALRMHAEVRRLEVSEDAVPAMALQFIALSERAESSLRELVEPFVEVFRREAAQLEVASSHALEEGMGRLREELAVIRETASGIEVADSSVTSASEEDSLEEDADEVASDTARLARLESQLSLVRERARADRHLRAELEAELSRLRLRVKELEDAEFDRVELQEKVSELQLQLQNARDLVRRSDAVARDALLRLELLAQGEGAKESGPDADEPPEASGDSDEDDSDLEEESREELAATRVIPVVVPGAASGSDAQAGVPDADSKIASPPPMGAETVVVEGHQPSLGSPVDEEVVSSAADSTDSRDSAGASEDSPDREMTLIPLLAEDEASSDGSEEESKDATASQASGGAGSDAAEDSEMDFGEPSTEESDQASGSDSEGAGEDESEAVAVSVDEEPSASDREDEQVEFELDLSDVERASLIDETPTAAGGAIALGSVTESARQPDEPAENFVALSDQALQAARAGRGSEYLDENAVDDSDAFEVTLDMHENEGESPAPNPLGEGSSVDAEAAGPTRAAFDWQEESTDEEAAITTETPTRPIRIEDLGRRREQDESSSNADRLQERREEVTSGEFSSSSASAVPAEKPKEAIEIGPEQIPTREDFVEHLKGDARLIKTERFHRLEPVSRADISVSDWLARTDRYSELAEMADDLMTESELQRVLHLFFERGLLVLKETP